MIKTSAAAAAGTTLAVAKLSQSKRANKRREGTTGMAQHAAALTR